MNLSIFLYCLMSKAPFFLLSCTHKQSVQSHFLHIIKLIVLESVIDKEKHAISPTEETKLVFSQCLYCLSLFLPCFCDVFAFIFTVKSTWSIKKRSCHTAEQTAAAFFSFNIFRNTIRSVVFFMSLFCLISCPLSGSLFTLHTFLLAQTNARARSRLWMFCSIKLMPWYRHAWMH